MTDRKLTAKERVLAALQKRPMGWAELWAQTGLNSGPLKTAIAKLLDEEKIETKPIMNEVLLQLTNPPE